LFKKFEYKISDRQVGNIMNENNWFCNIRRSKKRKENKNLNAKINDLVLRDFDNKQHKEEILATDVTYIPSTYDCLQNNVYLSVVISHITKEIIGWKLSMNNDVKLIVDSFDSIKNKTKNVIVHSDHGACYTSSVFT
jgi:putative transposase